MNATPYPLLDALVSQLRQLPEISPLLEYGYNGEPQLPPPTVPVPGLTDIQLLLQWNARVATFIDRLHHVAGGPGVALRARQAIAASLTADDARVIRTECGGIPAVNLGVPNQQIDSADDVVNLIIERMLLADDQFRQNIEVELAISRHLRSKR